MLDFLFSSAALVFSIPAIVGTALFVFKLIVLAIGIGHFDHGGDASGLDPHHSDSAGAFKLLSIQSLIAFAMGFGWAGLGLIRTTDWSMPSVMLGAVAAGILMAWLLGLVLRSMFELQASGNIPIQDAVGKQGSVYVSVPGEASGRGQVQVVVDGKQRTYNATTTEDDLPTGTRVRVLAANDDNTITVARA